MTNLQRNSFDLIAAMHSILSEMLRGIMKDEARIEMPSSSSPTDELLIRYADASSIIDGMHKSINRTIPDSEFWEQSVLRLIVEEISSKHKGLLRAPYILQKAINDRMILKERDLSLYVGIKNGDHTYSLEEKCLNYMPVENVTIKDALQSIVLDDFFNQHTKRRIKDSVFFVSTERECKSASLYVVRFHALEACSNLLEGSGFLIKNLLVPCRHTLAFQSNCTELEKDYTSLSNKPNFIASLLHLGSEVFDQDENSSYANSIQDERQDAIHEVSSTKMKDLYYGYGERPLSRYSKYMDLMDYNSNLLAFPTKSWPTDDGEDDMYEVSSRRMADLFYGRKHNRQRKNEQ